MLPLRTSGLTQTHIRNLSAVIDQDGRPVSDNAITSTLWPSAVIILLAQNRLSAALRLCASTATKPSSSYGVDEIPSSRQNNLSSNSVVHY